MKTKCLNSNLSFCFANLARIVFCCIEMMDFAFELPTFFTDGLPYALMFTSTIITVEDGCLQFSYVAQLSEFLELSAGLIWYFLAAMLTVGLARLLNFNLEDMEGDDDGRSCLKWAGQAFFSMVIVFLMVVTPLSFAFMGFYGFAMSCYATSADAGEEFASGPTLSLDSFTVMYVAMFLDCCAQTAAWFHDRAPKIA